jgi:hypothetical protein
MMAILHTIKNLKMINVKKIDNYFFYENINHYINAMTGHRPNGEQSQDFLSTMHTMIDDLDTISPHIDEHTYLRLVNGLQRLYNIHNSSNQSPSSIREPINQGNQNRLRENLLDNNEVEITRILAQHYGRVYDSSGALISNEPYPINDTINVINSDANTISDANVMIRNDDIIIDNNNNNNNYDSLNQALFRENARISYTALYTNAYDYWNQVIPRTNIIAR